MSKPETTIRGWGPDEYESLGPNWVEKNGEVLPPSSGQAFNTDPGAYEEYLTEVARKTAAAAAIAACRKTLWENHLRREGWEEPNWEQIAADAQAQHLRDNAA
ncbi:MAG TPA: hypothetical protein PKA29_00010 [Candidatus Saccharibacteria bacterium]|nr:hypothetical protein [Candidatus Saccharibacteria bacterium]